jgi:hypothetical protein
MYIFKFAFEFFFSWFDFTFEGGELPSIFNDVNFVFNELAELLQLLVVHLNIIHIARQTKPFWQIVQRNI